MPKQVFKPIPMFTLDIESTGLQTASELFTISVGKTVIAQEYRGAEDSQEWEMKVEGARQLVLHAGGIVDDDRIKCCNCQT